MAQPRLFETISWHETVIRSNLPAKRDCGTGVASPVSLFRAATPYLISLGVTQLDLRHSSSTPLIGAWKFMMYETDHHVTVDGTERVFRTYDIAESAAEARARGREKLRFANILDGKVFHHEFGLTVEKPGVQQERDPVQLAANSPASR